MTTMQITLPDDIAEAVRIEAEHFGTTPEQRVQRLIEEIHRHRVNHPRAEQEAELNKLLESGDVKTLRGYLPTSSEKAA